MPHLYPKKLHLSQMYFTILNQLNSNEHLGISMKFKVIIDILKIKIFIIIALHINSMEVLLIFCNRSKLFVDEHTS